MTTTSKPFASEIIDWRTQADNMDVHAVVSLDASITERIEQLRPEKGTPNRPSFSDMVVRLIEYALARRLVDGPVVPDMHMSETLDALDDLLRLSREFSPGRHMPFDAASRIARAAQVLARMRLQTNRVRAMGAPPTRVIP